MSTALWILIGVVILAACSGAGKGVSRKGPHRIDRPHYIDDDDARPAAGGLTGTRCPARTAGARLPIQKRTMVNLTRKRTSGTPGTRRKDGKQLSGAGL